MSHFMVGLCTRATVAPTAAAKLILVVSIVFGM